MSLLQPRVRHETDEAEAAALANGRSRCDPPPSLPTPVQARANDAGHP